MDALNIDYLASHDREARNGARVAHFHFGVLHLPGGSRNQFPRTDCFWGGGAFGWCREIATDSLPSTNTKGSRLANPPQPAACLRLRSKVSSPRLLRSSWTNHSQLSSLNHTGVFWNKKTATSCGLTCPKALQRCIFDFPPAVHMCIAKSNIILVRECRNSNTLNLTHDERVDISPTYGRIRNPAMATSNSDSTCTGQRSVAAKP